MRCRRVTFKRHFGNLHLKDHSQHKQQGFSLLNANQVMRLSCIFASPIHASNRSMSLTSRHGTCYCASRKTAPTNSIIIVIFAVIVRMILQDHALASFAGLTTVTVVRASSGVDESAGTTRSGIVKLICKGIMSKLVVAMNQPCAVWCLPRNQGHNSSTHKIYLACEAAGCSMSLAKSSRSPLSKTRSQKWKELKLATSRSESMPSCPSHSDRMGLCQGLILAIKDKVRQVGDVRTKRRNHLAGGVQNKSPVPLRCLLYSLGRQFLTCCCVGMCRRM